MRRVTVRLLAAAAMLAATPPAEAAHVPFVGCASDGQQGPQPPPKPAVTPDVPARAAAKLAFYTPVTGPGVLAPRGWHCFGTHGSNGGVTVVAPRPLDWTTVTDKAGIAGPAVQLDALLGDTAGRFEVAPIAARLFPEAARDYLAEIRKDGIVPQPLVRETFPDDRVTHRSPTKALFTTPARKRGLGTQSHLVPGPLPIDGEAIFYPADDQSLTMLAARLPPALRPLVAIIVADVARRR